MTLFRLLPLAAVLAAAWTSPARADTLACTEITTLPKAISTQGVYCLKQSLDVTTPAGWAIGITANNVTLDCNGNQLRATANGTGVGIMVAGKSNVVIRNCVLTGYFSGIDADGDGLLIEDNTIVRPGSHGIQVSGGPNVVRRNLVFGVGGTPTTSFPTGISVSGPADVIDNTIAGVAAATGSGHSGIGLKISGIAVGEVSGNRIWGVTGDGAPANGISVINSPSVGMRGNDLLSVVGGFGVHCNTAGNSTVIANWIVGFSAPVNNCFSINNQQY